MAYTLDVVTKLGTTGLTDLRAQLFDTAGANVGAAVSTGFAELGTSGAYNWHYTAWPDGHRGGVYFYSNAASSTILDVVSINPQEAENTDVKTSSVQTAVAAGSVASVTGNVGGNVVGSVGSLATQAKADVNAEVVDVLTVDTIPELPQAQPSATPTFRQALALLYTTMRNENVSTPTEILFKNDSGIVIFKASLTLVPGVSLTRAELISGP